jgi:cytochrome c oxidase assembly protein subunit 15
MGKKLYILDNYFMDKEIMYNKWVHRFSVFTALNTFILIFIGGLVTSTGSGLAVPDWPTTYGENMFTYPIDKWIGGIKYEHGHRLFASFVGLLTMVQAIWIGVKEQRRWVRNAGFVALAMVSIQGILGGITVLMLLPTSVSVAHGMTAQLFFSLVSVIALVTSRWWLSSTSEFNFSAMKSMVILTAASAAAVLLQLMFGAILRHTYSGLAIPDFPLAYGQIFPSLSAESMEAYNAELLRLGIKWTGDTPIKAYQIVIHSVHRFWAYGVVILLAYTGYKLHSTPAMPHWVSRNGRLLMVIVVIQFLLGVFTVVTRKEILITTAHVACGAATLVICVVTLVQLLRITIFSSKKIQ